MSDKSNEEPKNPFAETKRFGAADNVTPLNSERNRTYNAVSTAGHTRKVRFVPAEGQSHSLPYAGDVVIISDFTTSPEVIFLIHQAEHVILQGRNLEGVLLHLEQEDAGQVRQFSRKYHDEPAPDAAKITSMELSFELPKTGEGEAKKSSGANAP